MNVVMCGSQAKVYGEDVRTYKTLPVGTYDVCFNPNNGFSLYQRPDLVPNEGKIYGNHIYKVNKVLRTFGSVNRNLGVILSGRKGSGKSLFVRILCAEAISKGLPVIVISAPFHGLADFISSIDQECLVVFDEFEKIYGHNDDEQDPQNALLPLFDGMDNGKKLFIITCNELNMLNDCLLNRPGRFHYHFCVGNPQEDEVREYLTDNLLPQFNESIERIVKLSAITDVTYDFLRAIVFELNQGYSLEESLQDLNISNDESSYYDVEVTFDDGRVFKTTDFQCDFNDSKSGVSKLNTYDSDFRSDSRFTLKFFHKDAEISRGTLVLSPDKAFDLRFFNSYDDHRNNKFDKSGKYTIEHIKSIVFKRSAFSGVTRYTV